MNFVELIGYLAAILTTISFVPQVVKIIKTKSTKDISWLMYTIFLTGILLWLIYGFYISSVPIILANGITSLLVTAILWLKYKAEKDL